MAVAWAWVLARLHSVPLMPGVLVGLGLSVWIIYVVDRVLDTVGVPLDQLDVRHRFYGRWRSWLVFAVLPVAVGYLAWIALWVVPAGLMWQCAALALLIALYLAMYSSASRAWRLHLWLISLTSLAALLFLNSLPVGVGLKIVVSSVVVGLLVFILSRDVQQGAVGYIRKELAGGVLFALGCTAWSRFIIGGHGLFPGFTETLLLAALFTCNLMVITRREKDQEGAGTQPPADTLPDRAADTTLTLSVILAATLFWQLQGGGMSGRLLPLLVSVSCGLGLLIALHGIRSRLSVLSHRVLADLAVLLPVGVLLALL